MSEDLKLGGDAAVTLTSSETDLAQGATYPLPVENTGTWCTSENATCDNQSLMRKTGAPNGYLYNWYAATAGTGVYGTGANQNASASICPKGWKLPTKDQYVALDVAYGGNGSDRTGDTTQVNKFLASPLNFNYTGYVGGGSVLSPSGVAYYWSRTANSEAYAYNLLFQPNGRFSPQYSNRKHLGFAVRCVAAS